MAQVIAPEIWQEGIDDNRLLPSRCTTGLFTGSGVPIANNVDGPNSACRVWDIQVTDYITDYDDRRINGLANIPGASNFNENGRDGWGASAYGVFQDVRFDSRVYTMGRHRSIAMRIFDEQQYTGGIGQWGTETTSNISTNGQALMKTAQLLSKAKDIWTAEVLGPDIDKYNLFAVMNGHISGRWVPSANYVDRIMDGDASHGSWIAQPGPVEGQAIPPRFAPIHCIEWDDANVPLLLQNIKVTWNNLHIPQDSRVIIIDPMYEYRLLSALTGKGIPATEAAYNDLKNGSFTRLMGWDFRFDIPSEYWPKLYVDLNLNVVHSANGQMACDKIINSVTGGDNPDLILQNQLVAAHRMGVTNYVRTDWDPTTGTFVKSLTNYPLGQPAAVPYYGEAISLSDGDPSVDQLYGTPTTYPWSAPGVGYGLHPKGTQGVPAGSTATGPQLGEGTATLVQVIGCAVYTKAAQLSQEYSEMVTDEGRTRGKFTEMVMDIKYDAWVIESLSHGILPIIDAQPNTGTFAIPVEVIGGSMNTTVLNDGFEVSGAVDATVTNESLVVENSEDAPLFTKEVTE